MAGGWIVQMTHFLDDHGQVPALPAVRRHAAFFGSIVVAISSRKSSGSAETAVRCRKRPERQPCLGLIHAHLDRANGEIHWECPVCGDWGVISGWEGTQWDRSGAREHEPENEDAVGSAPANPAPRLSAGARRLWDALGPAVRLQILNSVYCVKCRQSRAMALTGGGVNRGDLVLDGCCTVCGGEVGRLVETGE